MMQSLKKYYETHDFPNKGKKMSQEFRDKISVSSKNRKKKHCPHCNMLVDASNYVRWHGDNCKLKTH